MPIRKNEVYKTEPKVEKSRELLIAEFVVRVENFIDSKLRREDNLIYLGDMPKAEKPLVLSEKEAYDILDSLKFKYEQLGWSIEDDWICESLTSSAGKEKRYLKFN